MLSLNKESILNKDKWQEADIILPNINYQNLIEETKKNPTWIHFGAGNIFRGFLALSHQKLIEMGKHHSGIIAAESFDYEVINRAYKPYDNLSLLVIMNPDGKLEKTVIQSITDSIIADATNEAEWSKLQGIFKQASLQMASFTITEKGYGLKTSSGEYFDVIKEDMKNGPTTPIHTMSKLTSLAYTRYQAGKHPIALVSMDNCSHNGDKLHNAVKTIAEEWVKNGFIEKEFLNFINDETKVSFPITMIDKITPRPSEFVKNDLENIGFKSTEIICTDKNTYTAPFVNAEGAQYLVIEDKFPNGRIPLEEVGVMFTDRETVNKIEKMKVCTCLNPLHTALAIFGCLLGHTSIAEEMRDNELKQLVEKIGYDEGLKVVVDPKIINPKEFIKEVLEVRFPNKFIPDTPQRIASDTSQKVAIRFGETIKAYDERDDLNPANLKYIPITLAGWLRYLLAIDDKGNEFTLSPDPMIEELTAKLSHIQLGKPDSIGESLKPILSNSNLFGVDLYKVGLGEKVESYFKEMIESKEAVRNVLKKYLEQLSN